MFTGEPLDFERLLALAIAFHGDRRRSGGAIPARRPAGETAEGAGRGMGHVDADVMCWVIRDELRSPYPATTRVTILSRLPARPDIFLREALGHARATVGTGALAILAVATAPLTLIVGIAAARPC